MLLLSVGLLSRFVASLLVLKRIAGDLVVLSPTLRTKESCERVCLGQQSNKDSSAETVRSSFWFLFGQFSCGYRFQIRMN